MGIIDSIKKRLFIALMIGLMLLSFGGSATAQDAKVKAEAKFSADQVRAGEVVSLEISAEVPAGYDVTFEFCAEGQLDEGWPIALMVWDPTTQEVAIEAPLEEGILATVSRASWGSCLNLGHGFGDT